MAAASSSTGSFENVFHEITQVASSSTTLKKEPFDVFINHRGPDVKLKLASPIYNVLDMLGVKAFFDREELDLGDLLPQAIEDAMRSALIHIAIFSKGYAGSTWCLTELSFMLETGVPIIPVFYDVQPADLRWGLNSGLYADAFLKYNRRYKSETLEKWKTALYKVSHYSGYIFQSNGDDEGILLKRIVNRVRQEIKNVKVPFEVAAYPVGLDNAVRDFEGVIASTPGHQNVQIVGIVGMNGCGKTTLARELYNRKHKDFDNCSFLPEVKESALQDLQKKLLEDLLHLRDIPFKDASQGKSILAGRLKSLSRRVLIVLDDVDHVIQLNSLLPDNGRSLGSGGLIIVTTCNWGVLRSWDISSVYEMTRLDTRHAKELFSWHAFLKPSPPGDFEDLVQEFIKSCDGLPLSLKVIAEMLSGRSVEEWKSNLKKIHRLLPGDITKKLKLCYDALDEEEQAIFLDVACFFIGEKKNLATAVWEAAKWSGLENLVNKCLVEVDKQDRIRMHNHLRDMGRKIATECRLHRLWSPKQISIIRSTQQRTSIRGIMAATTQFIPCPTYDEFPKCCHPYRPPSEQCMDLKSLQLLVVNGKYFTSSDFAGLSMNLAWLRFFDFQDKDLPSWLSVTNLRVLELYGASGLQLLENNAHPPKKLKEMIITATKGNIFHKFPSKISGLEHLRKIALISDHGEEFRFATLPDDFCCLQSLEHLELRHCKLLSSLPDRFGELKKLHHLDLCSCQMLYELPESFKELINMEYLDLSGCKKLLPMPDILKNIRKLKNLYLSGCPRLQELPQHTTDQQSLRELHLQNTNLRNVPSNISQLSKLETLRIGSPYLTDLPTSLGDLSSLTNLKIKGCAKLEFLPQSVERLKLLESLYLDDSEVKSLPEGFRRLTNLQSLQIFDCPIDELDFGSASSSSLGKLKLIHLKGTNVRRVSISQDCCPSLETLQLEQNYDLTEIEILSTSVKIVKVYECTMLHNMKGIADLVNLQTLEITECPELDQDTVAADRRTDVPDLSIVRSEISTVSTVGSEISTVDSEILTVSTVRSEISTVDSEILTVSTVRSEISTVDSDILTVSTVRSEISTVDLEILTASTVRSEISIVSPVRWLFSLLDKCCISCIFNS